MTGYQSMSDAELVAAYKQAKDPFESALSSEGVSGKLADVARSIYKQESSSGKNTQTSNAGAVGGMQMLPATFSSVADKDWSIKDPVHNARAGIRYLKMLDEQSGGDPALTAAGYYGGPGGLEKARRGIAVSDPRNPNAPNTLQYGQQVAARLPKNDGPIVRGLNAVAGAVLPAAQAETQAESAQPYRGMSDAELMAAYQKTKGQTEPSLNDKFLQGAANITAGAVRGAGSIGKTLLAPYDMAKDAIDGKDLSLESNRARGADMDAALESLRAQPDSWAYKGGKLAGEVAGTAGVGGVIAKGAQALGAAPALVNSIASGGLSLRPASFVGPTAPNAVGNALTRLFGGSTSGAAMAGLVDPREAGVGAVVGGALPGVVKVAGVTGNALYDLAQGGANRLMQSAIKPTIAQLRTGDAGTAIEMLLKYGINPTRDGVNKLRGLIDDLNTQIGDSINTSTATVSKQKVLDSLNDVRGRFSNQVSPTGDLKAIAGVADDFAAHPNLPLSDAIPVQQAQEMKQGTYKVLAKKYGQIGSAETEAQKGLARGLKEEVASAVPGVQALNAEESRLITTLNVAERRALMELNKNPMGLAALAGNPVSWGMFMADRSAAFKALAARMVNRTTPAVGAAGQKMLNSANNPLIRAGVSEANP